MKNKIIEQKVKNLYKRGSSLREITEKLGISLEHVRAIIDFGRAKKEIRKYRSWGGNENKRTD